MTDAPDLSDPSLYINRELSWLAFNQRVLAQAKSDAHPVLERVKFLAITANNLDEFFMVRVATLARQRRAGHEIAAPDGLTAGQCLTMVRARAEEMLREIADCWDNTLAPILRHEEIVIVQPSDYTPQVRQFLEDYFSQSVCPVLTPLAFDPGHPFPYISNRSKNFAVVVKGDGRTRFARVKVPDVLPRFVPVPPLLTGKRGLTFALLEDVIRMNLGQLFPGVEVVDAHLFRVIRETDIVLQEEEAVDLLESVDQGLREIRYGPLSLLQVDADMPARVLDILIENFEIERDVVLRSPARLGFADWMALTSVERPKLKDTPLVSRVIWHRRDADGIFEHIKYRDTLLHHPFDSFATFEAFLDAAVDDEHVVAIKMTLYRVGNKSPLVERLMAAAEAGKQVAVLVELKARFDERSNIGWAARLEESGVHVVYGLMNLKTHCKLCLVIRKEGDAIQRYVHIGTGNYNRATAQVYTDFGLFTSNARIAADASELFNYLTGYSKQTRYRELIVAPVALRERLTALIERETEHQRAGPAGGNHHQEQRDFRPGHHSSAVRRIARRRAGACDRARNLLSAARHRRRERNDTSTFDRRPFSRALPRLLLRERRRPHRVSRQRGSDGAQSRSARRDAVPRARSRHRAFYPQHDSRGVSFRHRARERPARRRIIRAGHGWRRRGGCPAAARITLVAGYAEFDCASQECRAWIPESHANEGGP